MTEVHAPVVRPDTDIRADIESLIVHYPPLNNDRFHIQVRVEGGVALLSGHVRSFNTYSYFMQALEQVPDLRGVNADYLHVDENIRLEVGSVLPAGLIANVSYGTVVLSGKSPDDMTIDEVVARIGAIPGVVRVVVALRD